MARAEQAAQRGMIQIAERTRGESLSELSLEQRSEQNGIFYGKESTAASDLQESESSLIAQEAQWKGSAFLADDSPVAKVADTAWKYFWIIWLAAAFAILIRKMTVYQSYIRYVTVGAEPVNDAALIDRLAMTAQEMRIGRPIELRVNPLVATPMLVGCFYPCIVLPRVDVSEKEFQYIVMHELTHYKRGDIVYKWLVQLAVCLHWFNPFVYVMRREIEIACEFACDEAVIRRTGYDQAKGYGETLLNAMTAVGAYREPLAAVTMSANKELLKERLGAIMNGGKKTKMAAVITAGLTVGIILGAVFIGVFPTVAADKATAKVEDMEKYYSGRSLPMFHIAFGKLDEKEQEAWLDRIYADGEIDFFSVSVWQLDADSLLIQSFAEKFYEEDDIAFFSVLADQMDEKALEKWLERALADEKWNFQSMLDDKLGRDDESDALEKAKEDADSSTGSDAEDAMAYPREMVVSMPVCRIREGAGEAFQVIGLLGEGEVVTVLGKKEGADGRLWYLLDQEALSEQPPSVEECYIRADLLQEK